MRTVQRLFHTTTWLLCASGCDYTRDTVGPGYYGEMSRPAASAMPDSSSNPEAARNAAGDTTTLPGAMVQAGMDAAPRAVAGASSQRPVAGAGAASSCDLSGPWLLTLHKTTDGLGNLQYIHNFFYYEIEQQGESLVVTKSLQCGTSVAGGGAFAVTVDYTAAAMGVMERVSHDGRSGTSRSSDGACQIELAKQYTVAGATLPHYLDPSTTLPNADQMASDGTPGWEDWDGDGNPGITGVCEGTVNGKLFTAARDWVVLSGNVPSVDAVFTLDMDWDQEQNVMAFEGSPFLSTSAVRAADPRLHFAQFARLTKEQAGGEDAALCSRLVELAPQLTPEAAGM